MDESRCASVDYPSNWSVDPSSLPGYYISITDHNSASLAVSIRPALKADNYTRITLEDVKNSIASHDTSIPNLANIPNLYDFQSSAVSDGIYLDYHQSIKADIISDLGFTKVKKTLFATIVSLSVYGDDLFVFVSQQIESNGNSSVLQHIMDSAHIMS